MRTLTVRVRCWMVSVSFFVLAAPVFGQLNVHVDPDHDGNYDRIRRYPVSYEDAVAAFAAQGGAPWNGQGTAVSLQPVPGVVLEGLHSWDGFIAFLDQRYPSGSVASFALCDDTINGVAGDITWDCTGAVPPLDCFPPTDCEGWFTNGRIAHSSWSCVAGGDPVCPGGKPLCVKTGAGPVITAFDYVVAKGPPCKCDLNNDCLENPNAEFSGTGIVFVGDVCRCTELPPATDQCVGCSGGEHWVDVCTTGEDLVTRSIATVRIDRPPFGPGVEDTELRLEGLVAILRSAPLAASVNFPSVTGPPGHAGPDIIDTEIVAMSLSGGGAVLRAGTITTQPVTRSFGAIAEASGDNKLADSFFDVFFELDLGGGQFGYNQTALHVEDPHISCAPPAALFAGPSELSMSIFSQPSGGVEIARITLVNHSLFIPTISEWGVAVMTLLILSAATVVLIRRRSTQSA